MYLAPRRASGTPGLSSMAVPTPWHWRGCQRTPRPLAVVIVSPSHRACQAVPPVFRCTLHARTGGWQLGTELAAFPEAAVLKGDVMPVRTRRRRRITWEAGLESASLSGLAGRMQHQFLRIEFSTKEVNIGQPTRRKHSKFGTKTAAGECAAQAP